SRATWLRIPAMTRTVHLSHSLPTLMALALLTGGAGGVVFGDEPGAGPASGVLHLNLRTRVEAFKGSGAWDEVLLRKELAAREAAVILCDRWDKHWCPTASERCGALAQKMVPVLAAARARGVVVIHAPSECMDFYKDTPQRTRMQELPRVVPPKPLTLSDPPLPIDDSDGRCDAP